MVDSTQSFVCNALDASYPLVRHLFDVAEEWSAPRQRKGAQIAPARAREALCAFDGSPCELFVSPSVLLHRMRANVTSPAPLRVLSLSGNSAVDSLAGVLSRSAGWAVSNASLPLPVQFDGGQWDVLLLPRGQRLSTGMEWLTLPLRRAAPVLALVLSESEAIEEDWAGGGAASGVGTTGTGSGGTAGVGLSFLRAAAAEGYGGSLFPGPASEATALAAIAVANDAAKAAASELWDGSGSRRI